MKTYAVKVPICGHAFIQVDAESEAEAHEKAMESVTIRHIEEWDSVERFNQGNICFCPHPWEIETQEVFDENGEPCDP